MCGCLGVVALGLSVSMCVSVCEDENCLSEHFLPLNPAGKVAPISIFVLPLIRVSVFCYKIFFYSLNNRFSLPHPSTGYEEKNVIRCRRL